MNPGRQDRARWTILCTWLIGLALVRAGRPEESDQFWQTRAGLENLDGAPLVRPDSWSWAPVDALFYPNSPGWNIVLALGWKAGDFWGLFVVTALAICAYFGLVISISLHLRARPLHSLPGILLCTLLALPMVTPRGTLPAQVLLLLAVDVGYRWSARSSRPRVGWDAAIVTLGGFALSWTGSWIHLSWAYLAAVVAVGWAAIWILAPDVGTGRRAVLVASGAIGLAGGVALGPYGLDAFTRSVVVRDATAGQVIEWMSPFSSKPALRWAVPALVAVALATVASIWLIRRLRRDESRDPRTPLVAALVVIGLPATVAGLIAIRFIGIALLLLAPVAAWATTRAATWIGRRACLEPPEGVWRSASVREWSSEPFWRVVLGWVTVVLMPLALLGAAQHGQPRAPRALAALPVGCHLFAAFEESNAVPLVRPDVKVWFDSRFEYYGRQRMLEASLYEKNKGDGLVPRGTTCVIIPDPSIDPEAAAITGALDTSPEWVRQWTLEGVTLWLPSDTA